MEVKQFVAPPVQSEDEAQEEDEAEDECPRPDQAEHDWSVPWSDAAR